MAGGNCCSLSPLALLLLLLSILLTLQPAFTSKTTMSYPLEYYAAYRFSFNGYLVFPVNPHVLNCSCPSDCIPVGVTGPESIVVNLSLSSGILSAYYNIDYSVFDISGRTPSLICNASYTYRVNGTLLGPLPYIYIEGNPPRIVEIPFYYASLAGEYRFIIFDITPGYSGIVGEESYSNIAELGRIINETLEKAGITVAYARILTFKNFRYLGIVPKGLENPSADFDKLRVGNLTVFYYTGYVTPLGQPPGDDYSVGSMTLSRLETAKLYSGGLEKPIRIIAAYGNISTAMVAFESRYGYVMAAAVLWDKENNTLRIYSLSPYPLIDYLLYHWESGLLLKASYRPLPPFIIGVLLPPLDGNRSLVNPKFTYTFNKKPLVIISQDAESPEEAAMLLLPERINEFLETFTAISQSPITIYAYDIGTREVENVTVAESEGPSPILFVAAPLATVFLIIAYLYYRKKTVA